MGFKPKFNRQEITDEDMPEDEIFTEEIEEEEPVKPQPKKMMPTMMHSPVKSKPSIPEPQTPKIPEGWSVQQIPTEHQPFIYNPKDKKFYNIYEALAELLNRTEQ